MKTSSNQTIKNFRGLLRRFERALYMQNSGSCCNGITLAQCHTLLEIENKGKESVTELARTLGLDKSTISRTVDGLVNNGLLHRSVPADNRRMATLQLTHEGKDICCSINTINDQYFEDVLSEFSEKEKSELIHLLERVVDKMGKLRMNNPGCHE